MNEILSLSDAHWIDEGKTVLDVTLRIFSNPRLMVPYTFRPYVKDDSPIHNDLLSLFKSNRIRIAEPDIDAINKNRIQDVSSEVRSKRNKLLSDTDYLMQPDYPISDSDREALRSYRQALRDITQQEGFPENIVWPDKPSYLK